MTTTKKASPGKQDSEDLKVTAIPRLELVDAGKAVADV